MEESQLTAVFTMLVERLSGLEASVQRLIQGQQSERLRLDGLAADVRRLLRDRRNEHVRAAAEEDENASVDGALYRDPAIDVPLTIFDPTGDGDPGARKGQLLWVWVGIESTWYPSTEWFRGDAGARTWRDDAIEAQRGVSWARGVREACLAPQARLAATGRADYDFLLCRDVPGLLDAAPHMDIGDAWTELALRARHPEVVAMGFPVDVQGGMLLRYTDADADLERIVGTVDAVHRLLELPTSTELHMCKIAPGLDDITVALMRAGDAGMRDAWSALTPGQQQVVRAGVSDQRLAREARGDVDCASSKLLRLVAGLPPGANLV